MAKTLMLAYTSGPTILYLSDIGLTRRSGEEMARLPTTRAYNSNTTEVVTVNKGGLDVGANYSCCRWETGIRFALSTDIGVQAAKATLGTKPSNGKITIKTRLADLLYTYAPLKEPANGRRVDILFHRPATYLCIEQCQIKLAAYFSQIVPYLGGGDT